MHTLYNLSKPNKPIHPKL